MNFTVGQRENLNDDIVMITRGAMTQRTAHAVPRVGYILLRLGFHPAPILLGFALGPRFEETTK
jgi:TctA family transporter